MRRAFDKSEERGDMGGVTGNGGLQLKMARKPERDGGNAMTADSNTDEDPGDAHDAAQEICQSILSRVIAKLRAAGGPSSTLVSGNNLPDVVTAALQMSSSPEHRTEVVQFATNLSNAVASQGENEQKMRLFSAVSGADPGIFFPFCRKNLLTLTDCKEFVTRLQAELASRCPGREMINAGLAQFVARRLLGDMTARWPLLYGPPGTGKSYMATILCEALKATGVKAEAVLEPAPQSIHGVKGDEMVQALLGTDQHWSNGDIGTIYRVACHADVVLVLLDEAEKGVNRDFLVTLLDPRLPLRDNYLRGYFPGMDLRHKALFILTANELWPLCHGADDPLWSRLSPMELTAYQQREMEEVIIGKTLDLKDSPYDPTPTEMTAIIRKARERLGDQPEFRSFEDEVNRLLFLEKIGMSGNVASPVQQRPRKVIPLSGIISRHTKGDR